jgi:hypothetical protein
MNWKDILITALICVAVVTIVNRVTFLRNLVVGA